MAPMAPKGVECIAGVHCDPVFGPVVMFGLGGVFVEVLKDVSFRLAPFGRDVALEMIREIKGHALLQGARGAPPCDIGALADALAALSHFAHARRADFSSVEINLCMAPARASAGARRGGAAHRCGGLRAAPAGSVQHRPAHVPNAGASPCHRRPPQSKCPY